MIDAVRGLVVRMTSGLIWRIPGHAPRKLESFAQAEDGSRIDLLAAAHATTSLERRAAYLRHALDETRHAAMFARRANELRAACGMTLAGPPRSDSESLFAQLGEIRFLAFVHRGERRGRRQFEIYARHFGRRGDDRTRAMFDAILIDEAHHESYTLVLLRELCGEPHRAARELRRAAWWQAWRTWRRAGRALSHLAYSVAMTALYLVIAPLAWVGLRHRRGTTRKRWLGNGGPTTAASSSSASSASSTSASSTGRAG